MTDLTRRGLLTGALASAAAAATLPAAFPSSAAAATRTAATTAAREWLDRVTLTGPADTPVAANPPTVNVPASFTDSALSAPVDYTLWNRPDLITVYGAHLSISNNADPWYYTPDSVTPGTTDTFQPWAIEVQTDAPKMEFTARANGCPFRIVVDGVAHALDGTLVGTDGGNVRILVDFGSRAFRTVRFESDAVRWGFVTVNTTDTLLPARYRGPRMIVVGDSIVEGTGSARRFRAWPWMLGNLLGIGDTWASGSGGTGYTTDAAAFYTGRKKVRDRLASDVLAYSPDIVVFAAGHNDTGNVSSVGTEVAGCIADTFAALPDCTVFTVSPLFIGTPPQAVLDVDNAIRGATAGTGATYRSLLQPLLWGGSGDAASPDGTGPADNLLSGDGQHPTQAGHEAIARAVAAAMTAR